MSDLTIANTIIEQLGHSTGRLTAMIGAHSFVGDARSVAFKFTARAKNGANYVRITLDPSDTYTVEFSRVRGINFDTKGGFGDLYAEDLAALFEQETGLYLHL